MRISVFYDHITQAMEQTGRSIPELLGECRDYGIEGLEINCSQLKKGGAGLYRIIREAGLSISCIYEFHDFIHGTDLALAREQVDFAVEVGAEKVLIVPGFLDETEARALWDCCERDSYRNKDCQAVEQYMESNTSIRRVREALRELVCYGRQKNLKITLEDFDGFTSPCSGMFFLKWFMEQVPGLGHTLDMGNYAYSDESVEIAYELLHPYVVHVHCKDRGMEVQYRLTGEEEEQMSENEGGQEVLWRRHCQGLAGVPVGSGYLPIRELVERLRLQGYDGYLAIEHFNVPDQLWHIRKSAEFLRALC